MENISETTDKFFILSKISIIVSYSFNVNTDEMATSNLNFKNLFIRIYKMDDLINLVGKDFNNHNVPTRGYTVPIGGHIPGESPERTAWRLNEHDVEFNNLKHDIELRDQVFLYWYQKILKQEELINQLQKRIDLLENQLKDPQNNRVQ